VPPINREAYQMDKSMIADRTNPSKVIAKIIPALNWFDLMD